MRAISSIRDRPTNVSIRVGLFAFLAVVLSVVTVGIPSTMILVGVWLYAGIFNRWVETLSGPSSWTAGLIVEISLLLGQSGALAILDPHPHPQVVYVGVLMSPLIIGGLIEFWLRRTTGSRGQQMKMVSGEPWLALVIVLSAEAMFEAIKLHGHDFGISWNLGSDSLSQVMLVRAISLAGGVTLHQLSSYPSAVNAISAVIDGAGGRTNLAKGVLLTRDVQSTAATIILACVASSALFAALIAETIPRREGRPLRIQPAYYIPLFACATLGVGSFVFGLTISGGFLTAIGAVPFVLASELLGMRAIKSPAALTVTLLALTVILTFLSWTALVVIPASILVIVCPLYVRHLLKMRKSSSGGSIPIVNWFAVAFSLSCLAATLFEIYNHWAVLLATLRIYGGIVGPVPAFAVWMGVACAVALITAPSRQQRMIRLVILCTYASGIATTLWLRHIAPLGVPWSYYAIKMLWLATIAVLWVPFVVIADVLRMIGDSPISKHPRRVISSVISLAGSGGMIWYANYETPFPMTIAWQLFEGRTYPSPQAISRVVAEANIGGPFVLWDYPTYSFSTYIGNWWAMLSWDSFDGGSTFHWKTHSLLIWVYSEENGTIQSLCTGVQAKTGTLRIVTMNANLSNELKISCSAYRADLATGTVSVSVFPAGH